jgi:negative regulator of sigma-B (phosphoserine phosphatase)
LSEHAREQTLLEVGAANATLPGELVSGDLHLVEPFPGGVLVAAVDGLGHGGEAAQAALRAVSVLEEHAAAPLTELFERCHARLARTRGVVMSLAAFADSEALMTWVGVGNVEGTLVRAQAAAAARPESILLLGGVLGHALPRLRPSTTPVNPGDTLIFATDGVHGGYLAGIDPSQPPQELADRILSDHFKGSDDALVLVARYRGGAR